MAIQHIFISHAWKYSEDYNTVVRWLNEAQKDGELTWSNYSVPEHDPLIDPGTTVGKRELQRLLRGQISPSSKVIVISGMYVAYSDWIDYEIDTSVDMSKYIIGLRPWGAERVPVKVQRNANVMVGWNRQSLVDAILEK